MKNERILSYTQAKVMTKAEIEEVSGAGWTSSWTAQASWQGGVDGSIDGTGDF